jgi:hypothetical protein
MGCYIEAHFAKSGCAAGLANDAVGALLGEYFVGLLSEWHLRHRTNVRAADGSDAAVRTKVGHSPGRAPKNELLITTQDYRLR